jgi:GDP-D-mannose dehydratase
MPKRLSADRARAITDLRSYCRGFTRETVEVVVNIMKDQNASDITRLAAAKIVLERGWGKPSETHHIDMNGDTSLLKVVNEIVHVHETREQIEFRDQTPLLELNSEDGNGSKKAN